MKYTRNGFSHHALIAKFKVTIMFANRDEEYFVDYGVNKNYMNAATAKLQKLEKVSTYEMDKEKKVLSTKLKNEARNEFYKSIRNIRKRFSLVYPISSTEYKQTMDFNISSSSDNDFIRFADKMIDGLKNYSSELSVVNINAEQMNYLQNQLADFKNIVNINKFVHAKIDKNTKLRLDAMEEVYTELKKLCRIGKIIWEDTNPAFYKDYILNNRRNKRPSNLNADSPPPTGEIIYSRLDSLE